MIRACPHAKIWHKVLHSVSRLALIGGVLSLTACLVPPGTNAQSQMRTGIGSPMLSESFSDSERGGMRAEQSRLPSPSTGSYQAPQWGGAPRLATNGGSGPLPHFSLFQPVKDNTWRTRVPAVALFPMVVRHLSESYIIRSTTPSALSVQTDWDKFFIGGRLFRNRISISLFQISASVSEIVINNKVEYYQTNSEQANYGESDWIPTQDITNEKTSLIESLTRSIQATQFNSARR